MASLYQIGKRQTFSIFLEISTYPEVKLFFSHFESPPQMVFLLLQFLKKNNEWVHENPHSRFRSKNCEEWKERVQGFLPLSINILLLKIPSLLTEVNFEIRYYWMPLTNLKPCLIPTYATFHLMNHIVEKYSVFISNRLKKKVCIHST